jgi:hypothetical protein
MSRAWPFEEAPRRQGQFRTPASFLEARGGGTEAVVIRIGLNDAQLVLVDRDGGWDRWVYHSVDEAKEVAEKLEITVHEGEYPEEMRVRMNARQRAADDYDAGAYPEQGRVGPVIPYPENRPREMQDAHLEAEKAEKDRQKAAEEK